MAYDDSDFDRLFDEMRRSMWGPSPGAWGAPNAGLLGSGLQAASGRMPMVDVLDEGDRFVVTAELPGVRKEEIHLQVRENVLRIHAERTSTIEQPTLGATAEQTLEGGRVGARGGASRQPTDLRAGGQANYLRRERQQMVFDRTIRLPDEVRDEQAHARFANGVLTLTLPKANPDEGGRNIPIE